MYFQLCRFYDCLYLRKYTNRTFPAVQIRGRNSRFPRDSELPLKRMVPLAKQMAAIGNLIYLIPRNLI